MLTYHMCLSVPVGHSNSSLDQYQYHDTEGTISFESFNSSRMDRDTRKFLHYTHPYLDSGIVHSVFSLLSDPLRNSCACSLLAANISSNETFSALYSLPLKSSAEPFSGQASQSRSSSAESSSISYLS